MGIADNEKNDESDPNTVLSRKAFGNFSKSVLMIIIVLIMMAPLYPLLRWTQESVDSEKVGKIFLLQTSCVFIFALALTACTTAKRHEIFTASVG